MRTATQPVGLVWALVVMAAVSPGCDAVRNALKTDRTRFLSPEKVIRAPSRSPINPILPWVGSADEAQDLVPGSTLPTPADLVYDDRDYLIGPTDILDVSVLDLFQVGQEAVLRREVSASGHIRLPLLKARIRAEGLSQDRLRGIIGQAYQDADILRDPTVSITIAAQRKNVFSILGAVARPGAYNVVRKDMRLLEALALAGGVTQSNIRYMYVIRPVPAVRRTGLEAEEPTKKITRPGKLPEIPKPPRPKATTAPASDGADRALKELREALPGGGRPGPKTAPRPAGETDKASAPAGGPTAARERWTYVDGQWIRGIAGTPPTTGPGPRRLPSKRHARASDPADPYGWLKTTNTGQNRIIAINLRKLKNGISGVNIVVQENDIIHIPTLEVGEFYVMGEVLRPGVYSLTGRRVTVKMAVAAAGNLAPLAWPENSILIRRVGEDQEQIIPLDIEEIFRGERPDVYLKRDDVIAVGTEVRASFFAVMRNAFRMTYGFGFIYDRNFADPFVGGLNSKRFTRW